MCCYVIASLSERGAMSKRRHDTAALGTRSLPATWACLAIRRHQPRG
jgi:hypothetical protein